MKKLFLFLTLAGLGVLPALADPEKNLVNMDDHGIALQGYDPVSFFTQDKPMKGKTELHSLYQGATYLFASQEDKTAFEANPAQYAPQFGGFCAYGVSQGHTAQVKIDAYQIVDGKLLMQYDQGVRDLFNQDKIGNLAKAQANWPKIVADQGK